MTATISDCGRYRYSLERWLPGYGAAGTVLFIGVNPSTADASTDDATVRKWNGFARRWGFGHMAVGNLFAYRATDVRELAKADDPTGPDNDDALRVMLASAHLVVPCWGSCHKLPPHLWSRIVDVRRLLRTCGKPVRVLGLTTSQDPKHPLMLGYSTPLQNWNP